MKSVKQPTNIKHIDIERQNTVLKIDRNDLIENIDITPERAKDNIIGMEKKVMEAINPKNIEFHDCPFQRMDTFISRRHKIAYMNNKTQFALTSELLLSFLFEVFIE